MALHIYATAGPFPAATWKQSEGHCVLPNLRMRGLLRPGAAPAAAAPTPAGPASEPELGWM